MDLDFLTHAPFWVALGQIIIIDILLGGDNAVVIALACRKLPPEQRKKSQKRPPDYMSFIRLILRPSGFPFSLSCLRVIQKQLPI
jgi:hypothetical protein